MPGASRFGPFRDAQPQEQGHCTARMWPTCPFSHTGQPLRWDIMLSPLCRCCLHPDETLGRSPAWVVVVGFFIFSMGTNQQTPAASGRRRRVMVSVLGCQVGTPSSGSHPPFCWPARVSSTNTLPSQDCRRNTSSMNHGLLRFLTPWGLNSSCCQWSCLNPAITPPNHIASLALPLRPKALNRLQTLPHISNKDVSRKCQLCD